jgi:predicted HicB family RNase H-like nuclease
MTTTTADTAERQRRATYMGERHRVSTRVRPELAERLEREARADRRSVSEYVALLLERACSQEAAPTS